MRGFFTPVLCIRSGVQPPLRGSPQVTWAMGSLSLMSAGSTVGGSRLTVSEVSYTSEKESAAARRRLRGSPRGCGETGWYSALPQCWLGGSKR
jgi:hypothetical protein